MQTWRICLRLHVVGGLVCLPTALLALLAGQWRLWACGVPDEEPASICITEIVNFPRQRKCLVRYIAGEWQHFGKYLKLMETYARGEGCNRIEAYMRKGLGRMLPPDWTTRHVIMVKEL
ncbi:MAG: hypothetical protein IH897_10615 [Planctomycetes bacterium]|nr:hypothetical protein [Planctomycetota bacterium]